MKEIGLVALGILYSSISLTLTSVRLEEEITLDHLWAHTLGALATCAIIFLFCLFINNES